MQAHIYSRIKQRTAHINLSLICDLKAYKAYIEYIYRLANTVLFSHVYDYKYLLWLLFDFRQIYSLKKK